MPLSRKDCSGTHVELSVLSPFYFSHEALFSPMIITMGLLLYWINILLWYQTESSVKSGMASGFSLPGA